MDNMDNQDNNKIALTPQGGFALRSVDDIKEFVKLSVGSIFCPSGLRKPQDLFVCISYGLEIGLSPVQAMQTIHVINGKPCMAVKGLRAMVQGSGLLEHMDERIDRENGVDMTAHCTVKRVGMEEQTVSFSSQNAKEAGLWGKGAWKSYPERMLKARACGFALSDVFSDVVMGLISKEEADDWPVDTDTATRDVTLDEEVEVEGLSSGDMLAKQENDNGAITIENLKRTMDDGRRRELYRICMGLAGGTDAMKDYCAFREIAPKDITIENLEHAKDDGIANWLVFLKEKGEYGDDDPLSGGRVKIL
jgi:hypothetical protein